MGRGNFVIATDINCHSTISNKEGVEENINYVESHSIYGNGLEDGSPEDVRVSMFG